MTGSGSLAATPTGPGAVLKVTVPYNTQISARGADWGIIRTQNPDARFADILAAAAREDAGLDVTPRLKVAAALEEAGVDAGLHPDAAHLQDAARAAGCAYFLTVDVLRWQCDYVLFNASSTVEFDLTCRASAGARELWSVHVFCRSRALTDGEVARLALAEAFHWLQTNDPGAAATAPEARGP